jgi:hypothetical protein
MCMDITHSCGKMQSRINFNTRKRGRFPRSLARSSDRLLQSLAHVVRGEASLVIATPSGHEFIDLSEDFGLECVATQPARSTNATGAPWQPDQCRCHVGGLFAGDPRLGLGPRLGALCPTFQKNLQLKATGDRCIGRLAAIEKGASGLDRTAKDRPDDGRPDDGRAECRTDARL